jgi:hypothetical protein
MTKGRCEPSESRMGFTACTHFLDLAIAALLSLCHCCSGVLHLLQMDNQMVADQLYSLILTGFIGSRDRSAPCAGLVTIGRTVAEPRWKLDRMDNRGGCLELAGALNNTSSIWLANSAFAPLNMPSPVSKPRTLYDKIWDDHVMCVTFWQQSTV